MRRTVAVGLLAFIVLVLSLSRLPAFPGGGPPSIQDQINQIRTQVASADCIVVGKVTSIEDKKVVTGTLPDEVYHTEHKVAVVKVTEVLLGPKDLGEVRIAFKAVYNPAPQYKALELAVDQEGCFAIKRHHEKDFSVILWKELKTGPNYERDLVQVRRTGRCLRDTLAGLKSKEADDRLVTASLLIDRYRPSTIFFNVNDGKPLFVPPGKAVKQEQIDKEESKLILSALAEADWTVNRDSPLPSALQLFARLGVTADDGFTRPANFAQYSDAAKAWVKEHADTYRIKRVTLEDTLEAIPQKPDA
jgi:hypothetical protein